VRPAFRVAPELEGQWVPSQTTVYLWRDREGSSGGSQADVRVLEGLYETDRAGAGRADLQVFHIDGEAAGQAAKVLSRHGRWSFWGWPRRSAQERYSLVAAVAYQPQPASTAAADQSAPAPADRVIAEWSDVYTVSLNAPWAIPLIWWPIVIIFLATGITALLRLLVPSPNRLALDMRLEENVAVVEPVRFDNPVLVDLHDTPLTREIQLCTRYLGDRWTTAARNPVVGVLLWGLAFVVGPVQVFLRRAFLARRWAWAAIIPRIRGNARQVHTGLLCVWTGLGARRGRIWSSQGGTLEPPRERQVKAISLDLPYQADGVDRTIRVTIRVRRMASEETEMTAPGWPSASSELGS
jgi:hypothetical protein